MWWYSANVLLPAKMLKRLGLPISDQVIGDPPSLSKRRGLGPYFSTRHRKPELLKKRTKNDHLVEGFEQLAESLQYGDPKENGKRLKGLVQKAANEADQAWDLAYYVLSLSRGGQTAETGSR